MWPQCEQQRAKNGLFQLMDTNPTKQAHRQLSGTDSVADFLTSIDLAPAEDKWLVPSAQATVATMSSGTASTQGTHTHM